MLHIDTELRLDLAIAIGQVGLIAKKFGWELDDLVREGITQELLTCITFFLIRQVEPRLHEIHGIVYVDVIYKEEVSPQFNIRWQPGEGQNGLEVPPELCHDYNAVIDRVLQLAENASGCYWGNNITTVPTPEGDAFRKRNGYNGNSRGIRYMDCTKPISQDIQNSHTDAVIMRVRASDALMDGQLS